MAAGCADDSSANRSNSGEREPAGEPTSTPAAVVEEQTDERPVTFGNEIYATKPSDDLFAQQPLGPAFENLRYVIEGAAGDLNVEWTGRWGGSFTDTIDTSGGRHEIPIGETVRGVAPHVAIGGPASGLELGSLGISIYDGDQLLQECPSTDYSRTWIVCGTGPIQNEGLRANVTVTTDKGGFVTINFSRGNESFWQTLDLETAGSVHFDDVLFGAIQATVSNTEDGKAEVSIFINDDLAAISHEGSARVWLYGMP